MSVAILSQQMSMSTAGVVPTVGTDRLADEV
jgi:hypothetical protein